MQKMLEIKIKNLGKGLKFLNNNLEVNLNDLVVVETVRGIEIGEVVKVGECKDGKNYNNILRLATKEDITKAENFLKKRDFVIEETNALIKKYNLDMKIVDAEFTLDGSKTIISFVCEDRVDFRELVKTLASKLRQRVELRQIGIRDEAKIVGGIGICGKEICCKQYLNDFDKVSIKMAKCQNLSLNPTKISGVCGRLMCCLAFENETYVEALKTMPKINSKVTTPDGVGTVIYNDLLKKMVTVKFETDGEVKTNNYNVNDIKFVKIDNK